MKTRKRQDKSKAIETSNNSAVATSTKAISAAGVIAAMAVMILVNVLSSRHYERWDLSSAKLYTLSPATITTLKGLEQNVDVDVLLSTSDPLHRSVRNLLDVYNSKTSRLNVRFVDPDRHPAEFSAVQMKYDIVAGRTEDGRVVTDASIVLSSMDRHWFILAEDLVDFSELEDGYSKSKLEQALTTGIRAVQNDARKQLCFTAGHGEYSIDDTSGQGLGELRDRLRKNNYDVISVNSGQLTTQADVFKEFADCNAIVVVGPSIPFSQLEANAIAQHMQAGVGGFFLLSPILDASSQSQLPTGLESVARLFGIDIAADYVFEMGDDARLPRGTGEVFFPSLETHAVTDGLSAVSLAVAGMRVVTVRTRSFDVVGGEVQPIRFLKTTDRAFGMVDFHAWAQRGGDVSKGQNDRSGPLAIGMASELSEAKRSDQDHGTRLVVLGSANYALGHNFRDMALRGNAVLVGNIISWVAAFRPIVDVPAKITPAATLRITESSLNEIVRYVLIFMPGAVILLAVAMYLRRKSREIRPAPSQKTGDRSVRDEDETDGDGGKT